MNTEAVRFIVAEVLKGLLAMHDHFILHRGISLENIFITKTGHIKIGGLGTSMVLASHQHFLGLFLSF